MLTLTKIILFLRVLQYSTGFFGELQVKPILRSPEHRSYLRNFVGSVDTSSIKSSHLNSVEVAWDSAFLKCAPLHDLDILSHYHDEKNLSSSVIPAYFTPRLGTMPGTPQQRRQCLSSMISGAMHSSPVPFPNLTREWIGGHNAVSTAAVLRNTLTMADKNNNNNNNKKTKKTKKQNKTKKNTMIHPSICCRCPNMPLSRFLDLYVSLMLYHGFFYAAFPLNTITAAQLSL